MEIYTVFPLIEQDEKFPLQLPQDFDTYEEALEYGEERLGKLGEDFLIESPI